MKKTFLSVLLCCLILAGCFSFVACKVNYANFEGTYSLRLRTTQTKTSTIEELEESSETTKENEKIVLNKDQTFEITGLFGSVSGTYEISGNTIIFHTEETNYLGSIINKEITISNSDAIFIYKV